MEAVTGMLIDINLINDNYSHVEIDDSNNNVRKFKVCNGQIKHLKLGNYVVIYKDKLDELFNIKLISDLI